MKKAFIFYGGWEGHEPEKESARFQRWLEEENYQVTRVDTLDRLEDAEYMKTFDLIVPCWTQGTLPDPCCFGVSDAVAAGTGLAGVHGGMCDSFRWSVEWQYMTGSQWSPTPEITICTICPSSLRRISNIWRTITRKTPSPVPSGGTTW